MDLKWIRDRVWDISVEICRRKYRNNFRDVGLGKEFLDVISKVWFIKEKEKLDFVRI